MGSVEKCLLIGVILILVSLPFDYQVEKMVSGSTGLQHLAPRMTGHERSPMAIALALGALILTGFSAEGAGRARRVGIALAVTFLSLLAWAGIGGSYKVETAAAGGLGCYLGLIGLSCVVRGLFLALTERPRAASSKSPAT